MPKTIMNKLMPCLVKVDFKRLRFVWWKLFEVLHTPVLLFYQRFEYKFGTSLAVYNYGTLNKLKRVIHLIKEYCLESRRGIQIVSTAV